MTTLDMLAGWPGWDKKPAEEILNSPAWSMIVRYGDEEMRMRLSKIAPRDVIGLRIAFDGEEHFLGLGNREIFPDLNVLWNEKKRLPGPLILALVEKECSNLLQLLENATRMQLSVIGLADAAERADAKGFEVVDKDGKIIALFSLSLSKNITMSLGDVANIDTGHSEIRKLEMPAKIQYATFMLNEYEASELKSGDYLLLPEAQGLSGARWLPDGLKNDGEFHVIAAEDGVLTFGGLADGVLPGIPAPSRLCLVRDGKTIAVGSLASLGEQSAFAIEEVL